MSDDLLTRLRQHMQPLLDVDLVVSEEAADEIVRLRVALAEARALLAEARVLLAECRPFVDDREYTADLYARLDAALGGQA